jgi:hypothetical protein
MRFETLTELCKEITVFGTWRRVVRPIFTKYSGGREGGKAIFYSEDWTLCMPPKRRIISAILRGVVSHKIIISLVGVPKVEDLANFYTSRGRKKLKLKLIYDRQSVGQSVLVSGAHLEPMIRFILSLWRLRVSWCVAPSLTRRRVCNLLYSCF